MTTLRNEELREILEAIDLESWLDGEGVRYRKQRGARGEQLNVKTCPCCGTSEWKVYLNADSGLGNCFSGSCETKFNKWTFIKAELGLESRAVIERLKTLAREQGWRPPRMASVAVNLDPAELKLPESIALPHNGRNLKYLDQRGITGDIARYFNLRFSLHGVFKYVNEESGRPMVQSYANRVIIPIFDTAGELVSFQGRDTTGDAERKYLFPPGYASTGKFLFNGQNAVGAKRIVIGEGVFDVAATKIALDGDPTLRDVVPVGSFGKHLSHGDTDSQLARIVELARSGLEHVTIMWDAEKAAIQAAVKTALVLKSVGVQTRVAILPKGCDPNETTAKAVREAYWTATAIDPQRATKLMLLAESF